VPESDTPSVGEQFFSAEDMVSASELREFVFCERAWFLAHQGHAVLSANAREQRAAGTAFHESRATAARSGKNAHALWWAVILLIMALAAWLFKALEEKR
jgi:hypothetical protein